MWKYSLNLDASFALLFELELAGKDKEMDYQKRKYIDFIIKQDEEGAKMPVGRR
jgi:hypothetical protein